MKSNDRRYYVILGYLSIKGQTLSFDTLQSSPNKRERLPLNTLLSSVRIVYLLK